MTRPDYCLAGLTIIGVRDVPENAAQRYAQVQCQSSLATILELTPMNLRGADGYQSEDPGPRLAL
jgi:hypothetical protein